MTPVAPRIATRIKHTSHFGRQAQYLARLEGYIMLHRIVNDASYDEDQACEAFCMAGAIFGEVGG